MLVTKTTNRLPFQELSSKRFEDLCLGIVFRMRDWDTIRHYGRKGKDGGVDIYTQLTFSGSTEFWFVQCKNYQKINLSELKKIIDEAVKKNKTLPDKYLLIISCDVTKDNWEELLKYSKIKNLNNVDIISGSVLETYLFSKHHDLLYIFFGIDVAEKRRNTISKVKRRLLMKKKIESQFGKLKFRVGSEVIIRDVNNDIYPENIYESKTISPWFKLEFFKTYYRGIVFIAGIEEVHINENGGWMVVKCAKELKKAWTKINAYKIAYIPYDNIAICDFEGDEYYPFPHLYCEFNFSDEPYEKFGYAPVEKHKKIAPFLDEKKQIKTKLNL